MTQYVKIYVAIWARLALSKAQTNYPVYFEPKEDERNPIQRVGSDTEYDPIAPNDWSRVSKVCRKMQLDT